MSNSILRKIKLNNKTEYKGIIDYTTSKHYVFYDMTNNNDPQISLAIVVWQANFSHMRFSVFKSIHLPQVEVPKPYLLRKKDVEPLDGMPLPDQTKTRRSAQRIDLTK